MKAIEKAHMPRAVRKLWQVPAWRWFSLAALLLLLSLAYTALVTGGALDASTAQIEQWLLGRPMTRVDCLFSEWRTLGDPSFMLAFTLLLGGACLLLGYRWTVVPYLLVLLVACSIWEVVGKSVLTQPLPGPLDVGISSLNCPQIQDQPTSVQLGAAAGIWWKLPPYAPQLVAQIHQLARQPFNFAGAVIETSYPGGHAIRGSFVGVLAAWLCWRHIKRRTVRVSAMVLVVVMGFSVGFMQFYIGVHLVTDTIAGYLFGITVACCAIGLLLVNGPGSARSQPQSDLQQHLPPG
ncbi:MAG TPA: phosphatase PAP2 family protein [Ktedonobacterales bacterium]|nr:phosphatase PAP2 family protein [Ktedonobacterales bacterium]